MSNKVQESISDLVRGSFRNTMEDCVSYYVWSAVDISMYKSINDLLDSSMCDLVYDLVYDLVDTSVKRKYE